MIIIAADLMDDFVATFVEIANNVASLCPFDSALDKHAGAIKGHGPFELYRQQTIKEYYCINSTLLYKSTIMILTCASLLM